jgi:SAM-dependent methyltransferase
VGYLQRVFHLTEEENRRRILDLLPHARGGALLDVGCHRGDFTLRVAERLAADRIAGIELLDEHAEVARRRGIEVATADLDDGFPFADGEFDVVHANQVIEHVRGTDGFLREVRRVLALGGVACVSTNNLASWHNVLSLALGLQPPPMHVSDEVIVGNPLNPEDGALHEDRGRTHLRLFTPRALRELAAVHGLIAERVLTAGYYPLPPRLARAAVRVDALHGAFVTGLFRTA